jgi:hypothetical protein
MNNNLNDVTNLHFAGQGDAHLGRSTALFSRSLTICVLLAVGNRKKARQSKKRKKNYTQTLMVVLSPTAPSGQERLESER